MPHLERLSFRPSLISCITPISLTFAKLGRRHVFLIFISIAFISAACIEAKAVECVPIERCCDICSRQSARSAFFCLHEVVGATRFAERGSETIARAIMMVRCERSHKKVLRHPRSEQCSYPSDSEAPSVWSPYGIIILSADLPAERYSN